MARILDLTSHPAVYGARLLAEAGHHVVRVEPPDGDWLRRLGPFLGQRTDLEHGAYHQFFNAGKRSFTLDLTRPDAQAVFLTLAASAEVILGDNRIAPRADALRAANPGLVVTLMLDDGRPELCAYARSGLLMLTGQPGGTPMLMGGHVVYAATGVWVALATAAALLVRETSGRGQTITMHLQECLEVFMDHAVEDYSTTGENAERRGHRGSHAAVSGAFPCADGYWMLSASPAADRWQRLMDWVQDPVLMADPNLADEANRAKDRDMILDRFELWCKDFNKDTAVEEAQRRHIPSAPISTPLDIIADPQLVARGFLKEIDHPDFGRVTWPMGAMATLRGQSLAAAPRLGEHTIDILAELGFSREECQALVEAGAV